MFKRAGFKYERPPDEIFVFVGKKIEAYDHRHNVVVTNFKKTDDWDHLYKAECIECCDVPDLRYGDDWGFEGNLPCEKCGRKLNEVSPYPYQILRRCVYSMEFCSNESKEE